MARRRYTPEQKAEAVALYATDGPTAVQHQLGIPKQTVTQWAQADGVRTVRNETAALARDAIQVDFEARKAALVDKLLRLADTALAVEHDKLAKASLHDVVGARTRAIHDAQLLGGSVTSRTETITADSVDRQIEELSRSMAQQPQVPVDA